ncbi:MAG: FAD-dependent oxidoreductase [Desulfarculaceae bacterium]|nr:FAD-dependent oxidoreductase [Desulfarculaceae bacterium]MCF8047232.1 FAD-dependent oxidoreductase [Desulfarculaceae bacterium]MCF8097643.1 FAD-dependent oxidoreductase [Desulfarculaceae bacterium]MCF8122837.1 FAD-dependent oxidoreductase [Desulfarculaceae bacterium]
MRASATGLSLVLGRTLLAWCDQVGAGGLDRYVSLGGFQGLERAEAMTPVEVIAELRTAGLRDRSGDAEPVYLSWQRFLRRADQGLLVVDASELDPRHLAGAELLSKNPYGLLEALYVAARATGASRCRVLLPPQLAGHAAGLLNAAEQVAASNLTGNGSLELELTTDRQPSIMAHPSSPEAEAPVLMHDLETWYHVSLVMSLGADWHEALGVGGHTGTRLVTLLGAVNKTGLVETPMGSDLWQVVTALGEGVKGNKPLALAIDGGMGGYLPPSAAQISLATEELTAAGVDPGLGTLELLSAGECLVDLTRRVLYRYWVLAGQEPSAERGLVTRALRMVTEITRGKGLPHHLDELAKIGREMTVKGVNAAWPLLSSITYFREQWSEHVAKKACPKQVCLQRPLAPCHRTCPAGIDIPSFLALDGHGRYLDAVASISQDNPLPFVCGLVCPGPCEGACLRGGVDQPISIRAMKAVSARHALAAGGYPAPEVAPPSGKRVAIVGAGPGGLTAAFFLAKAGHEVTILEAQEDAGGMLRYGIPAYRLPHEALEAEVKRITDLGVVIKTGQSIDSIAQIRAQGYDAIFLAVGTQVSRLIPIEGVDQPFVLGGLDFLKDVRGGEDIQVGPRVVVVGGGNVSIDVALTAIRQGGKRVDMVCLEKRREMPAHMDEINQALEEGVAVHNSWGPMRINPEGSITFQRCTRVFDERGRFSPEFDAERTLTLEADQVILAIGQATDLACVEAGSAVEVQRGLICTDPDTLATREQGVFAGGDVVSGPRTVVEAVGAGKRAAASIDAYLKGEPFDPAVVAPTRRGEVEPIAVSAMARTNLRRPEMPMRQVADRQGNYHQIELGLTDQMAHDSASRCLRCDLCIGCGLCQLVCSEIGAEALRLEQTDADRLAFNQFTRPSTRCVGCGACGCVCPTGAIKVVDTPDGRRQTVFTGTVVKEHQLLSCGSCGEPYAPPAYLDHLKKRVGPAAVPHVERGICPACARQRRAQELAGQPFYGVA